MKQFYLGRDFYVYQEVNGPFGHKQQIKTNRESKEWNFIEKWSILVRKPPNLKKKVNKLHFKHFLWEK